MQEVESMQVGYIVVHRSHNPSPDWTVNHYVTYEWDPANTTFCCSEMEQVWLDDNHVIGFGAGGRTADDLREVQVRIASNHGDDEIVLTITYCPFCGSAIELVHTDSKWMKRIEVTEQVSRKVFRWVEEIPE